MTKTRGRLLRLAEDGVLVRYHSPAAINSLIAAGLLREVTVGFQDRSIFVEVDVCRLTPAGRAELARRPVVKRSDRRGRLDLETLVARLVEDVLRAVRGATLDDLRELFSPGAPPAPSPPTRRAPARTNSRSARRQPAPKGGKRVPAPVARRPRAAAAAMQAPEPPVQAEITDPERLLAGEPAEVPDSAPTAPHDAPGESPDVPPPDRPEPAPGGSVRLREGESLAGTAGGAIVIRRARRGIEPSALM
ncbi:MAG TPA: hypothetical protein VGG39_37485 [Polyangiaceae bacterium]|jgi:hypothetical protein